MNIGVLAVQGDFALHAKMLERLDIVPVLVKKVEDLERCDGLIIPGGESTTFVKLLKETNLFQAIKEFSQTQKIMGTCAGLIILSNKVRNYDIDTLQCIDITVERNAYGRQIDSFIGEITLSLNGHDENIEGVFIRAPKIIEVGEGVQIKGHHNKEIILAENRNVLVTTFHPELTEDTTIHRYFVEKIKAG